jgi:hypothetical protein
VTDITRNPDSCRCRQCGKEACPFWTPSFLESCRARPDGMHDLIRRRAAELFQASTVVYSDKNPLSYRKTLETGNRIDRFVVLFKRPEAAVFSLMTHDHCSLETALASYASRYEACFRLLADFRTPHAVVFYDDFAARPAETVAALCERLEIPFAPGMLDYAANRARFHSLGGNSGAYANLRTTEQLNADLKWDYWQRVYSPAHVDWIRKNHRTIALDEKWKTELSEKDRATVHKNGPAMRMFERLLNAR